MHQLTYILRCWALVLGIAIVPSVTSAESYVVDSLEFPKDMPPEIGAIDFASDGMLYISLRRGDIMVAKPSKDPKGFRWTRFATGFHNGCGMHIVKPGHVIVSQMAELTEVIDTDGDGTADEYNKLETGIGLSGNYHETNAVCPDGKGGLYIAGGTASHNGPTSSRPLGRYSKIGRYGRNYSSVQYRGWVMHRAADGAITPFSSGYRMHNGIEFDPKTGVWCGDNQGDWRAGSPVYHVAPDSFSGHPSSLVWDKRMSSFGNVLYLPRILLDDLWNKPAFHLPHGMIRSCAEPVFDTTGGKFGPFAGQMLLADQSGNQIIRCMPEMVDGAYQGAATWFYKGNGLRRGNNRLAFSPGGDTLYIGQTGRGWGSLAEGMQRIRFTGEIPFALLNCSLTRDGFDLTFTKPVAADSVVAAQFGSGRYRYPYGYKYGGGAIDKTSVVVTEAQIDKADGRTVRVVLDELVPNYLYDLRFDNVKSATGEGVRNGSLVYTLNRLRRPASKQVVTIEKKEDRLRVEANGKLLTEIRSQGFSNPILYPVNNPAGQSLVRDWPVIENGRKGEQPDHPHHKSLFIGHQGINGVDFWHEGGSCGTTEQVRVIEMRSGQDRALLRTLNLWKDSNGKVICSDTRELQFGVVDGATFIDLELNVHASHGDLTFAEYKDGFIGLRTHPHLRLTANPGKGVKAVFGNAANSEGVTGNGVWGQRANWIHYWGEVEGKDAGVAILSHPSNPRNPSWWHARDYGLIAVNPFGPKRSKGDGQLALPAGHSLTLRYRFLFHDLPGDLANIAKRYMAYSERKLVPRTMVLPIPSGVLESSVPDDVAKNVKKRGGTVESVTRYIDGVKSKPVKLVPNGFIEGKLIYVDRDFLFSRIPDALRGADLIMTYNNDKKIARADARYEIVVKHPSTLLTMVDTRIEHEVGWLKKGPLKFAKTLEIVQTDSDYGFRVYKSDLSPGSYNLGGQTGGSFYSIAVVKK
jgi:hypothetical protein